MNNLESDKGCQNPPPKKKKFYVQYYLEWFIANLLSMYDVYIVYALRSQHFVMMMVE